MSIAEKSMNQLSYLTGETVEREKHNFKTISSREVADMMEMKEHSQMLKKIDRLNESLLRTNISPVKYWFDSTYRDSTGRNLREYQVTEEGCKLIAHKTEGDKGVVFTTRYMDKFEQMKNQLQDSYTIDDPIERAKRWIQEQEEKKELRLTVKVQEQQIAELQPKASYYDTVLQSKNAIPISIVAKDYGVGAPTMNLKLHELGVQYKQGDIWLLYSKYQDKGYTQTKTHTYEVKAGETVSKPFTYWTQKGRLFIYDLLKQHGILPMIERDGE